MMKKNLKTCNNRKEKAMGKIPIAKKAKTVTNNIGNRIKSVFSKENMERLGFMIGSAIGVLISGLLYGFKIIYKKICVYNEEEEKKKNVLQEQSYNNKLKRIQPFLQKELFEVFLQFPKYKYDLVVDRREHIQIFKIRPVVKMLPEGKQYRGGIYYVRLNCKNKTIDWRVREFLNDWRYTYEQKMNGDREFFADRLKEFRPLNAKYELLSLYKRDAEERAIYLIIGVNVNVIDNI